MQNSKQLVKCIRPSVPVTILIPNEGGEPSTFRFESAGTIIDISAEQLAAEPGAMILSWDAESGVPSRADSLMLQALQQSGVGSVGVTFDFPNKVAFGYALINVMRPDMIHFIGNGPLQLEDTEVFYGDEADDSWAAE